MTRSCQQQAPTPPPTRRSTALRSPATPATPRPPQPRSPGPPTAESANTQRPNHPAGSTSSRRTPDGNDASEIGPLGNGTARTPPAYAPTTRSRGGSSLGVASDLPGEASAPPRAGRTTPTSDLREPTPSLPHRSAGCSPSTRSPSHGSDFPTTPLPPTVDGPPNDDAATRAATPVPPTAAASGRRSADSPTPGETSHVPPGSKTPGYHATAAPAPPPP